MCYYITGIISTGIDFEQLNRIVGNFGLHLEPVACSKTVQQHLRSDEIYVQNTRSGCDCCTDIGDHITKEEFNAAHARVEREIQRKKNKKRKKGWSRTKIERWEQQKQSQRIYTPSVPGADCHNWTNFIQKVFNTLPVKKFGLMKHWYDHRIDSEKFELQRTVFRREHLTAETLHTMSLDTLFIFINNKRN